MATTKPAALDWTSQLSEQLAFHWKVHLRPRLEGLGDAELHWEPVPGCWGIRPRADATTPGGGRRRRMGGRLRYPEPTPAPVTTIAWRLGHITIGCLGMRAANHFGQGGLSYETTNWPHDAATTLARLDEAYRSWMDPVARLTPRELAAAVGPAEGPFAAAPMATLVLHISREVIHHGAEVLVLRDLYRASGRGTLS